MQPSNLGSAYANLYRALCGRHPNLRIWHFQWLSAHYLKQDLSKVLPTLEGELLDVGCGDKPYAHWITKATHHVGIDVEPGAKVDKVITPTEPWPFANASFDSVVSTEVLEHVTDLDLTLSEIDRLLQPGGRAVITIPFLYNEHGAPNDYRRFTLHNAKRLLPGYDVELLKSQGGIGSTLSILLLNWLDTAFNLTFPTRLLKALLLPIALPINLLINSLALLVDKLDHTQAFYSNLIVVLRKPT